MNLVVVGDSDYLDARCVRAVAGRIPYGTSTSNHWPFGIIPRTPDGRRNRRLLASTSSLPK